MSDRQTLEELLPRLQDLLLAVSAAHTVNESLEAYRLRV